MRDRPWAVGRRQSLWRVSTYAGVCLGALVLIVAVVILMFGKAILSGYGKGKLERAFAAAHPGCALQIGELDYAVGADRLVARSVTLTATNQTLRVGQLSVKGVRLAPLLRGSATLAEVFAQGSLEATNLHWEFTQAHYQIRCARLRASVPDSALFAEGVELRPSVGDEAFFAAHAFRTPRFHILLPECRVRGLACRELLEGKAYRAESVQCSQPFFEVLLNRDLPPAPFEKSPLMVHEALATIRQPLQIGSLTVTNGHLRYCERLAVGSDPAVLTFGAVSASVTGLANHGDAAATVGIQAQGNLMEAGTLRVSLSIPITPPDFSLHYSGSLSAMDLTRLNAFLDLAEHTRITSGQAHEAAFEIAVTAGHARGRVRATYEHLTIAVLDQQTGTPTGLNHRVTSFLANLLKVRNANAPNAAGAMKEGKVDYTRRPDEEFLQFLWFALWSGVQEVISL